MRGGTSRGLFFREEDLPSDPQERDWLISRAYGSPDPYGRQIDGIGGATSTTSKVAVIGPPTMEGADVDYTFGQVSIDTPLIDRKGNCGNISSAVGPFAIDEGLVPVQEGITTVRIHNTNTRKLIVAHVPVRNGKHQVHGDCYIDGIPEPGAPITLDYMYPGGAVTGKLLPTGNPVDTLEVPGVGNVEVSIVDASNPLVFFRAADLGLNGLETGDRVDGDPELLNKIEAIRGAAAVRVGLADTVEDARHTSPAVPKIAWVAGPATHKTSGGATVQADEIDFVARIMSMGRLHRAYALTGAICTVVAAAIEGTVVHEVARKRDGEGPTRQVTFAHPAGKISLTATVHRRDSGWEAEKVSAIRTARRLMEGYVLVPERVPVTSASGRA